MNKKTTLVSLATNTILKIVKMLSAQDIHLKWSNLFWKAHWFTNSQITQLLKIQYIGKYMGNYHVQYLDLNISTTKVHKLMKTSYKSPFDTLHTSSLRSKN
jgi:hypothetical protein